MRGISFISNYLFLFVQLKIGNFKLLRLKVKIKYFISKEIAFPIIKAIVYKFHLRRIWNENQSFTIKVIKKQDN